MSCNFVVRIFIHLKVMSSSYFTDISVNSLEYREYHVYLILSASQISFKDFVPCPLHSLVNIVFASYSELTSYVSIQPIFNHILGCRIKTTLDGNAKMCVNSKNAHKLMRLTESDEYFMRYENMCISYDGNTFTE